MDGKTDVPHPVFNAKFAQHGLATHQPVGVKIEPQAGIGFRGRANQAAIMAGGKWITGTAEFGDLGIFQQRQEHILNARIELFKLIARVMAKCVPAGLAAAVTFIIMTKFYMFRERGDGVRWRDVAQTSATLWLAAGTVAKKPVFIPHKRSKSLGPFPMPYFLGGLCEYVTKCISVAPGRATWKNTASVHLNELERICALHVSLAP